MSLCAACETCFTSLIGLFLNDQKEATEKKLAKLTETERGSNTLYQRQGKDHNLLSVCVLSLRDCIQCIAIYVMIHRDVCGCEGLAGGRLSTRPAHQC